MSHSSTSYVLVVGHGRSGTNWLLDILDASPETHCRNEPNEILGSALEYVQKLWFSDKAMDDVTLIWEKKAALAKISMSERDHRIVNPKNHIHNIARFTKLTALPSSERARKILSLILPSLRQGEWVVPWWIANLNSMKKSCTVMKINMLAACFVDWYLQEYPQLPVIHIIRHPCGYLNSSINRFFSKCTPTELEREHRLYKTMLRTAVLHAPEWEDIVGNVDSMDLIEAVIWFWRVNNELIYLNGKNHSNYKLLVYEDIVSAPLDQSKLIFDFCNLQWNQNIETIISNGQNTSVWGKLPEKPELVAAAWKNQLSEKYQNLIMGNVLINSEMRSWWHD